MAYTLFEKTEIASYTDVSALLCVAGGDSPKDILWKFSLYGKLCWEKENAVLFHCGKYDHFSYKEFEEPDRLELHKLPQDTGCDTVKEYIDRGFFILLPINTKTLGYTETPYKHNVFVTGYDEDKFMVYDYWTPGFTWRYEKVNCVRLLESMDFTNPETVQRIYAFKAVDTYAAEGEI